MKYMVYNVFAQRQIYLKSRVELESMIVIKGLQIMYHADTVIVGACVGEVGMYCVCKGSQAARLGINRSP